MSREDVAAAFGRDLDPLARHEIAFESLAVDPFELFLEETGPRADNTLRNYRNSFRHWRRFMRSQGRHPACPSRAHVERYVRSRADDGVKRTTIRTELTHVGAAHSYWCRDEAFPHAADFDPFDVDPPGDPNDEEYPRVTLDDLREAARGTGHHLDRALFVTQLKLGLRAGEVCNLRLPEVNLGDDGLRDFYPDIGTHPEVEGRPGSLFVPCDREGNKSRRPRVLPLDDETRRALKRYLLIRPMCGRDGLFLSKREKVPVSPKHCASVWEGAMPDRLSHPEGARPVRSHYGRHHFTSWFAVHRDWNPELVGYMRGDTAGSRTGGGEAMGHYLHAYYEDVREPYLEQVYKLGV